MTYFFPPTRDVWQDDFEDDGPEVRHVTVTVSGGLADWIRCEASWLATEEE